MALSSETQLDRSAQAVLRQRFLLVRRVSAQIPPTATLSSRKAHCRSHRDRSFGQPWPSGRSGRFLRSRSKTRIWTRTRCSTVSSSSFSSSFSVISLLFFFFSFSKSSRRPSQRAGRQGQPASSEVPRHSGVRGPSSQLLQADHLLQGDVGGAEEPINEEEEEGD